MHAPINRPVEALVSFHPDREFPVLRAFRWNSHRYDIRETNSTHRERDGETVFLCYSVSCAEGDFGLRFNTDRCRWILDSIFELDDR